jgi:hypothetical protein
MLHSIVCQVHETLISRDYNFAQARTQALRKLNHLLETRPTPTETSLADIAAIKRIAHARKLLENQEYLDSYAVTTTVSMLDKYLENERRILDGTYGR